MAIFSANSLQRGGRQPDQGLPAARFPPQRFLLPAPSLPRLPLCVPCLPPLPAPALSAFLCVLAWAVSFSNEKIYTFALRHGLALPARQPRHAVLRVFTAPVAAASPVCALSCSLCLASAAAALLLCRLSPACRPASFPVVFCAPRLPPLTAPALSRSRAPRISVCSRRANTASADPGPALHGAWGVSPAGRLAARQDHASGNRCAGGGHFAAPAQKTDAVLLHCAAAPFLFSGRVARQSPGCSPDIAPLPPLRQPAGRLTRQGIALTPQRGEYCPLPCRSAGTSAPPGSAHQSKAALPAGSMTGKPPPAPLRDIFDNDLPEIHFRPLRRCHAQKHS